MDAVLLSVKVAKADLPKQAGERGKINPVVLLIGGEKYSVGDLVFTGFKGRLILGDGLYHGDYWFRPVCSADAGAATFDVDSLPGLGLSKPTPAKKKKEI